METVTEEDLLENLPYVGSANDLTAIYTLRALLNKIYELEDRIKALEADRG